MNILLLPLGNFGLGRKAIYDLEQFYDYIGKHGKQIYLKISLQFVLPLHAFIINYINIYIIAFSVSVLVHKSVLFKILLEDHSTQKLLDYSYVGFSMISKFKLINIIIIKRS